MGESTTRSSLINEILMDEIKPSHRPPTSFDIREFILVKSHTNENFVLKDSLLGQTLSSMNKHMKIRRSGRPLIENSARREPKKLTIITQV